MNIAFSPIDQRFVKIKRKHLSSYDGNSDSLWMAKIIRNVGLFNENYLLLFNPVTSYSIVMRLYGNWRNNIRDFIEKAFRREFEVLKEKKIYPGSYENYLDSINLIEIPEEYLIFQDQINDLEENIRSLKTKKEFPLEYRYPEFLIDLVCADHNLTQENFLNESPYQKLKKIFQYYPEPIVRKEVSFNENKGALERPQMFFPYAGDDVDPNEVALMDTNFIIIKEPVEINQPKFENIQLQIQELFDSPLARTDKDKIQEKVDKLLLEMNQYIGYYQTPFTGEYKNIEVPDELPEKPVFEFLITMDTEIYTVKRRVAVPADMSFVDFDKLLCHLFHWIGFPYHLSEFIFPFKDNPEGTEASEVLVWEEKDAPENPLMSPVDMGNLEYNNPFYNAKVTDIKTKKLSDYFPEFKTAQYRYDFGDNWFHSIELTGIYDESEYVKELPYLIESVGVAPADDMGGVEHFSDLLTYRFRSFDPEIYWRQIKLWLEERDNILRAPCSLKELF